MKYDPKFIVISSSEMQACKFCSLATEFLDEQKQSHVSISLANEVIKSMSSVFDRKPSVPFIFYEVPDETGFTEYTLIGGYEDLQKFLGF